MAKRLTDEQRIEQYFTTAPQNDCMAQLDKIQFILRIRGALQAPTKRGRPRKAAAVPGERPFVPGERAFYGLLNPEAIDEQ